MGIGIIAAVESKWKYLSCSSYEIAHVEIRFSLFDSYAVVNPFIAWRNIKLKGKAEQERAYSIGNTGSDKHALNTSKNGQNFAVVIIKKVYLKKRAASVANIGNDWKYLVLR